MKPIKFLYILLFTSFFTGAKIIIRSDISAHLGGQFWGLWSEFGENDFTLDTGLSWWIDNSLDRIIYQISGLFVIALIIVFYNSLPKFLKG